MNTNIVDYVVQCTNEAFDAFHAANPNIPKNLHDMIKIWGKEKTFEIADQRIAWVNKYLKENHPEICNMKVD